MASLLFTRCGWAEAPAAVLLLDTVPGARRKHGSTGNSDKPQHSTPNIQPENL